MRDVVKVSKSKEINQFIVENHTTMSQSQIADHFGVSTKSINCRVDRLRKKSVIAPFKETKGVTLKSLDDAYFYHKSGRNKSTKVTSKTKTNSYSNADGENKQKARLRMEGGVTSSGVTGTVLTLPHIGCTIEKMILDKNDGFDFIGCEIDKATYHGMRKTIRNEKLPITPHHGAISDMIYGVDSNTYAHMILDYCGSIVTFDKELRYAIQNNLVQIGGTIAVTFSKRGHYDPNNIIKKLANTVKNFEDGRGEMIRGVEAYFHKVVGFDYDITEIFEYQDKGKSPMVLVRIKRMA